MGKWRMQICVSSTPFIHWCPRVLPAAGRVFPTRQVYTSSLPREHFRVTCCGVGCRCLAVSPSLPVRAALHPIAFCAGAGLLQAVALAQANLGALEPRTTACEAARAGLGTRAYGSQSWAELLHILWLLRDPSSFSIQHTGTSTVIWLFELSHKCPNFLFQ